MDFLSGLTFSQTHLSVLTLDVLEVFGTTRDMYDGVAALFRRLGGQLRSLTLRSRNGAQTAICVGSRGHRH